LKIANVEMLLITETCRKAQPYSLHRANLSLFSKRTSCYS